MTTPDIESKKSKYIRWKLNLIVFIVVIDLIGLTTIIGSLNQINKNVNNVGLSCTVAAIETQPEIKKLPGNIK